MWDTEETLVTSEGTGRGWVRTRVVRELAGKQWNQADLTRASGTTADTISDFLTGKRWPQQSTRAKIAEALGWSADSLERVEMGLEPAPLNGTGETVGPETDDVAVLGSLPPDALEGLSPADRAEVIAAAKLSALQTAREIRRRLDT